MKIILYNLDVKYFYLTHLFLYCTICKVIWLDSDGGGEMEERVLISLLLDFYGPLLTDKQRMSLQLHHEDDMSLGEIAEELGVSRQAVHDNLQRARHILNDYESKLHLVEQYEQREGLLSQLKENLPEEVLAETKVQKVLAQMEGYYGI